MATAEPGNPDLFPESTLLPDDGDDQDAASVDVPFEAALDRTAWLRDKGYGKPLWLPLFSGRTTSEAYPTSRFQATLGLAGPPPTLRAGWVQTDVTGTGAILWTSKVPVGSYLHGVVAYVISEPVAVGSLPAVMPRVLLHRQPTDGSAHTLIAEVVDSSSLATFVTYHPISFIWGTATVLDDDDLVVVEFRGMQGGGAVNNALKLVAIKLVLDTQQIIVVP